MKKAGHLTLTSLFCIAALLSPLAAQETPKFLYGVASWYGDGFEGKPTASGEPFAMGRLTAAHKTLPFGTLVEVENLGNGKKVEVRINDRGPFAENRIIDLSKQAAEILDFLDEGKTFVKLTILEVGDPVTKPQAGAAPSKPNGLGDIPKNPQSAAQPQAPAPQPAAQPQAPATQPAAPPAPEMDEASFMNDVVPGANQGATPLRTQAIPGPFGEPARDPYGFSSNNTLPPPVSDPLAGQPDPAPKSLTPAEEFSLYTGDDAFGDLFNDNPKDFFPPSNMNQPQRDAAKDFFPPDMNGVRSNIIQPGPSSQNIGGDFVRPTAPPREPAPIQPPSYVTITNYVTIQEPPQNQASGQNQAPGQIQAPGQSQASSSSPHSLNPPQRSAAPNGYYIIQIGAFSQAANAMKIYNALKRDSDKALNNVYTADVKTQVKGRDQNVMRVRVGFFLTEEEALKKSAVINENYKGMGIKSSVIKVDFLP